MKVIGVAGHVDHGKSSLVLALTGIDPDRLAEEKARQMTIDLGFAWLTLPDGETVGVVDVPGHIDFIKNMLAGIGGIDAALLVIAADEGVMPQTREHLAILDLLNVTHGLVALNKVDLVDDPDWLELVQADVVEVLAGTSLAAAPVVPVSARTGAGLDALLDELKGDYSVAIGKQFDEEGRDFSGGEEQKIAIARALYKDAPVVVLDEPTAALDPITEFEVYSKFNELVGDKASIFISHRLSSCRFCHQIAVFDGGRLVQFGSHEQLLKDKSGKYFELWNAQAQHYVGDQPEA